MDADILNELEQIKWILLALFVCVFVMILYFVIATAMRVRKANTDSMLFVRDNFLAEMSLLESQGNYDALRKKSEDMLTLYPNDLLANWFNAIGNYKTGQLGAVLSAFGRIKQINSAWSAETVNELILEVKSSMGGPRRNDS
ncbi:MAG: hypothetical protein OEW68_07560 [Gammaproteobacteria bacterium]|nr:hypothetical protein [Gammaproteobacteria bacterium]